MKLSLDRETLLGYVHRLVAQAFPDGTAGGAVHPVEFSRALERLEHCFSRIERKYYCEAGEPLFDHLNGDHMATLLYFYANTVWRDSGDGDLATRLFYLNKSRLNLQLHCGSDQRKVM